MIKLKRINGQSIFEIPIETLRISPTLTAFFRNDQNKVYIFKNEKYEDKTISRFAQFMHLFHNKAIQTITTMSILKQLMNFYQNRKRIT